MRWTNGGAGLRILIVRLGAMGDCVHVLPALTALRESLPRAHIAWLVEDRWASLIRGHPCLDEVVVLPRSSWSRDSRRIRTFARAVRGVVGSIIDLRQRGFHLTLDFQGNCRSGLWAFLSGARSRIGFAGHTQREANYLFTRRHVRPSTERQHKVEKHLALLRAIGVEPARADAVLPRSDGEAAEIEAWMGAHLPDRRRPIVAIHPAVSRFGFFKRWPAGAYARLVRHLRETGVQPVLTWGPGERDEVERIHRMAAGEGIVGPETRSILSLVELLRRCHLFIGSDSGPLHLASAAGTPTVALYGPKDPARYGPRGAPSRVVRTGVDCSPCDRRSCSDPVCMTTLTPETVLAASLPLIRGRCHSTLPGEVASRPTDGS